MTDKYKEAIPMFDPIVYQCNQCKSYIWSKWPGEFTFCPCGAIAVDQTEYYERRIGKLSDFQKVDILSNINPEALK